MKALYNNRWLEESIIIEMNDRALQFGDGLFETIILRDGKPEYLDYHFDRMTEGAKILNLNLPWNNLDLLKNTVKAFVSHGNIADSNIKLMVWRKPSHLGGYNFDNSETNFLMIHRPIKAVSKIIKKADFAQSITFNYSPLSSIKTLNSLPYILASNEKRKRNLDEIIVLNNQKYICECSSSNIFWVKNDTYYTPGLESGCLDGIMRRVVIENLKKKGIKVEEKLAGKEELLEADTVFATNSLGVRCFERIADKNFNTDLIKFY